MAAGTRGLVNVGADPARPVFVDPSRVVAVGGPAHVLDGVEAWEDSAWMVLDGYHAPLGVARTGVAHVLLVLRGNVDPVTPGQGG